MTLTTFESKYYHVFSRYTEREDEIMTTLGKFCFLTLIDMIQSYIYAYFCICNELLCWIKSI